MFTRIAFVIGVGVGIVYFLLRYGPTLLAIMFSK
jgi:hypothetical protein